MEKTLSIASLNTWKCDGDYHQRVRLMSDELSQLNPDVILLQESFRSLDDSICTASLIAENLGKKTYYLESRRKLRKLNNQIYDSFSGLSIITSLDIQTIGGKPLISNETDGGRNFQYIIISNPYPILIIIAHLTFLRDRKLKLEQLDMIIRFVRNKNLPTIIGGDFNFTPSSEFYTYIKKELKDLFIDAMNSSENHDLVTLPKSNTCIDYILGVQNSNRFSFQESKVICNEVNQEHNCLPSDHFGLLTLLNT